MRLLLFLVFTVPALATSWTEFYIQPTGSNLNAGSTNSNAAAFTYAGGTFVRSTGVFTVGSGNPSSDGVAVGDFASIYTTAGATVATFVARVTARDATTITVSLSAIAGAATTVSETAAAATCKVGGAWAGMSSTTGFPVGFMVGTLKNATGNRPRVNIKGDGDDTTADYNVTAQLSCDKTGIVQWQGYTSSVGDGGKAVIDGGTSGAVTYYNLLDVSGPLNAFVDIIFDHNGGTGSAVDGVDIQTAETSFFRCVFRNMRRDGISISSRSHLVECEAHGNNTSNTTGRAGFGLRADGCHAFRCISHDNTGSNTSGFAVGGSALVECISDSNGAHGAFSTGDKAETYISCDFYNNAGDGIKAGSSGGVMVAVIENCNFVKNGGYGINFINDTNVGTLYNNRFGAGTQANTSGTFSTQIGMDQKSNSSYASDVTPWIDPTNGDFRITLAAAKNAGRGTFTRDQTDLVLSYPDIGSAQSQTVSGMDRTYKLNYPRMRR